MFVVKTDILESIRALAKFLPSKLFNAEWLSIVWRASKTGYAL